MRFLILLILFLAPISETFSQIYKVFQIKTQDTVSFNGTVLRLPSVDNVIHCDYLVELEGDWLLTNMTIDIATKGIEIYGYSIQSDGQFHLIARTNDSDQIYRLGTCLRYILIRILPECKQSVNFDFGME